MEMSAYSECFLVVVVFFFYLRGGVGVGMGNCKLILLTSKFYIQKIKNFVLHGSWRFVTLFISLYSNDSNPWYPRNHDSAWILTILTNFNHQESKNLLLFFLYWEITFLRIFNNICKANTQYFTFDNEICQEPFSTSLLLTTAAIKGSRTRRMRISTVSETIYSTRMFSVASGSLLFLEIRSH